MLTVQDLCEKHIEDGSLVVFFYSLTYSGHAVEYEGVNYLLPLKMASHNERHYELYAVSVDAITRLLSDFTAVVNVLMLDSCRDNELNTTFKGAKGSATSKGMGKTVEGLPWVPDRPTLGSRFFCGLCQVPAHKTVSCGFPRVFRFPQLLLKPEEVYPRFPSQEEVSVGSVSNRGRRWVRADRSTGTQCCVPHAHGSCQAGFEDEFRG